MYYDPDRELTLGGRDEELPSHFTAAERLAYKWLFDCDIRPWLVDLIDKTVTNGERKFSSLIEFARERGMK